MERKINKVHCIWAIIILAFSLSTCTTLKNTHSLDELKLLSNIDQIIIYGKNQNENGEWVQHRIKMIDNPKRIDSIVKVVGSYADDWQVGRYYPYLPGRLKVSFYDGEQQKASIMIVSRPTEAGSGEQLSYFLSKEYGPARPIEEAEFKELIEFLGVDEESTFYDSSVK